MSKYTEEIIIDGVNVKECKRLIGKNNYCRYYKRPCAENNYNCIWKKYYRKEIECEELKDKIKFTEDYIETVENARDELEQKLEKIKEIVNTHKQNKCITCSYFDNCLGHPYCDEVISKIIEE